MSNKSKIPKNYKPKIISLFSGCGWFDLGFKQAGFNVVWANENNKKVWDTYKYNHPETTLNTKSIVDVQPEEIPDCDGIIGWPPCQSWSTAGKMGGIKDNRGQLFFEYIRILKAKKPKFFVAENVSGILTKRNIDDFKDIVKKLEKVGYNVVYKKLSADNFGVPQSRKRVIIIGVRKNLDNIYYKNIFPYLEKRSKQIPTRTIKDAIWDLPTPVPAIGIKNKNISKNHSRKSQGHEYYIDKFSSQYMWRNRKRDWCQPAYTVLASGRHARLHPSSSDMYRIERGNWKFKNPDNVRRFSVRESARLQTFPDDFSFKYKYLHEAYKMIGNAVPVRLAKEIALAINNVVLND